MIEIDGSHGEGGGSVLRNAVALSCAFRQPVRVFNIRAKRKNPGLQMQHLTGVRALARISNAKVGGLEKGSMELLFEPGEITGGSFEFDVQTAGSVTLVLQALAPACAFAKKPTRARIIGGTNVPLSPPVSYFKEVFLPAVSRMGYRGALTVERQGWYPKGGGIVDFEAEPSWPLEPLDLSRPVEFTRAKVISIASNLPEHVIERQAESAVEVLRKAGFSDVEVARESSKAICPGTAVVALAYSPEGAVVCGSALGELGKKAEAVGEEAARALLAETDRKAPVDRHLADQLLTYMALAKGRSTILCSTLTEHTRTNAWLIEHFVEKRFEMEELADGTARIAIDGVGFEAK